MLKSGISLDALGAALNCDENGHHKINVCNEIIALLKKILECSDVIAADLKRRIYENIGNIAVGSKNSCDKSGELLCIVDLKYLYQ